MVALFPDLAAIEETASFTWSDTQTKRAQMLVDGIQEWLDRVAPCLSDPNAAGRKHARALIADAINRALDGTGNIGSEGIGPSQVNYIDRAALPTLTNAEKAELRALCPKRRLSRYGTVRVRPGY